MSSTQATVDTLEQLDINYVDDIGAIREVMEYSIADHSLQTWMTGISIPDRVPNTSGVRLIKERRNRSTDTDRWQR